MIILTVGDVVGTAGCEFFKAVIPQFKRLKGIDLCIVNGENSAAGNGMTPFSAQFLLDSGADFITGGNHSFRRRECYELLDSSERIVRPANYYVSNPGKGTGIIDMGSVRVGVLNLSGCVYMDKGENPFTCADGMLGQLDDCRIRLVDFHAEATAEKRAMGFYLDGRVSAVFGTHTHVLTADEQILPGGTGYITDIGMTGVINSVLGVKNEISVDFMKTGMPARFDAAEGACMLNGCIFEIDDKTGKTLSVERVSLE